jgi:trimethylamine--corrinoid protein Co-methyltransferase
MIRFSILDANEIEAIHQASLRILAEIGVVLSEPDSLKFLTDAGARVHNNRILIPPELVEKCISLAGKKTTIMGRGGGIKTLGDGSLYFHNLGGAPQIFDAATGNRRLATVRDVEDCTRLLDALENCHTITPFFTPTELRGGVMSLAMYRHALPFTLKPLQGPGVQFAAEVRFAVRMAEVIGPPAQFLTLSLSPVSPLTIPDHEAKAIIEIARQGIVFGPLPCPTA